MSSSKQIYDQTLREHLHCSDFQQCTQEGVGGNDKTNFSETPYSGNNCLQLDGVGTGLWCIAILLEKSLNLVDVDIKLCRNCKMTTKSLVLVLDLK